MKQVQHLGLVALAGSVWPASPSHAAPNTYYVSPDGTADWADCHGKTNPCPLDEANEKAAAGDTVYLRGGTYTDAGIRPENDGHLDAWITFAGYPGEQVTFEGRGLPAGADKIAAHVNVVGRSFIIVRNVHSRDPVRRATQLIDSHHIQLVDSTFRGVVSQSSSHLNHWENVDYLYVESCEFDGEKNIDHYFDLIWLGQVRYALLYKSLIGMATHDGLDVIKSHDENYVALWECTIENKLHTGIGLGNPYGRESGRDDYYLVQYSTFRNGGSIRNVEYGGDPDSGDPALYMRSNRAIVRYNTFYRNSKAFSWRWSGTKTSPPARFDDNQIYNNTSYDHRFYTPDGYEDNIRECGFGASSEGARDGTFERNRIFNNVLWKMENPTRHISVYSFDRTGVLADNTFRNNIVGDPNSVPIVRWQNKFREGFEMIDQIPDWVPETNRSVDPLFAAPDHDPPDLTPVFDSPLIDRGVPQATAQHSGVAATTLHVDHALPFYSEQTWRHAWIPNPAIKSDLIRIGNAAPVRIETVDYDGRTIVVSEPRSWSKGAGVTFCPRDQAPEGVVDIGAMEYRSPPASEDAGEPELDSQPSGKDSGVNENPVDDAGPPTPEHPSTTMVALKPDGGCVMGRTPHGANFIFLFLLLGCVWKRARGCRSMYSRRKEPGEFEQLRE